MGIRAEKGTREPHRITKRKCRMTSGIAIKTGELIQPYMDHDGSSLSTIQNGVPHSFHPPANQPALVSRN